MSDDNDKAFEYKDMGLNNLIKALKDKFPTARVGVLGGKNIRTSDENQPPTNAEVGAAHEFGVPGRLPVRSFLRVPITENMQEYLERAGAFKKEALQKVIQEGTLVPYVKKIAAVAETIVADAFDTGGFGKWKPSDMKNKKTKQTLVETQQLRNSITSEVKE